MGWDERLFGIAFRRAKRWFARARDEGPFAHSALLECHTDELAILACAVAGRPVSVRAAERFAGWSGDTVWLPTHLTLARRAEENAAALRYAAVFSAFALRRGVTLPEELTSDAQRALATVLAALQTEQVLLEEFGGARALRDDVAALALGARPQLERLAGFSLGLELLVQRALGASGELLYAGSAAAWSPWVESTLETARHGAHSNAALAAFVGAALEAIPSRAARRARDDRRFEVVPQWGFLRPRVTTGAPAAADAAASVPKAALPTGTERPGRVRERVEQIALEPGRHDENPLVHSFEKVHTAEEYKGGRKALDGRDEMRDQGDALDELDLREVLRTRESAQSVYRVDAMFDGSVGDLELDDDALRTDAHTHWYDEWDEARGAYRRRWAAVRVAPVRERVAAVQSAAFLRAVRARNARQISALRAEFERLQLGRVFRNRQLEGPEIDDDAVVDRHASLCAGSSPPERLYRARRMHESDLAVLVLLDCSLSSDSWVEGRRVLDIARNATVVLGHALEGVHDRVGIAGFFSNTRRDCRFEVVKGFSEPWAAAWRRLPSIEPAGYTRIGPAVRHSTELLCRTGARRRLLLLVSDGRPTDYDRYEGRYGIADVRRAVDEAHARAVHVFALAVDARARAHFPPLFGRDRYTVLSHERAMHHALAPLVALLR